MKPITRLAGILALAGTTILATPSQGTSAAPAEPGPSVFKIEAIEVDGKPAGCVSSCQVPSSRVPGFARQSNFQSALADASKIDAVNFDQQGCAIVTGGAVRCWGSNEYGQLGDGTTVNSRTALVWAMEGNQQVVGATDVTVSNSATCVVISGRVKCVGYGFGTTGNYPAKFSSTAWVDLGISDVAKAIIGQNPVRTATNSYSTPVCVLTTGGGIKCLYLDRPGTIFDSRVTGARDLAFLGNSADGIRFCVAGSTTSCLEFSMGTITISTTFSSLDASTRVYIPNMLFLTCFYSGDTLYCENFKTGDVQLFPMGVMPQPTSIFVAPGPYTTGIVVLLPDGVLRVTATKFTCACSDPIPPQVSPIAAFSESSFGTYFSVSRVTAATNSPNVIPLVVESGSRTIRTFAPVRVETASGVPLSRATMKWTAPDVPGSLGSSINSSLQTDADGNVRTTLATGPVTFDISGGTAPNGAILQAASITVVVGASGTTIVTVPDPPALIDRTVTVLNADGTPVPGAFVAIRNLFIPFAYNGSIASTSRWASRAPDMLGNFGQLGCVYCYVPLPTYMTGSDGSVVFKSFAPSQRFTKFDATVSYDDGDLYMNVGANFTEPSSTVYLPFMAHVDVIATDADPSTSAIDIPLGKNGVVELEFNVKDENNRPVDGFTATIENVCGDMDTGGLIAVSTRLSASCGSVTTTSFGGGAVAATGLPSGCVASAQVKTASTGSGKFTFCSASSTKYRIRGKGAVASRTVCIVVAGSPCGASSAVTAGGDRASQGSTSRTGHAPLWTAGVTSAKRGQKLPLNSLITPLNGPKTTWRVTGGCSVRGTSVVTPNRAATCILHMTQVATTRSKVRGKWVTNTVVLAVRKTTIKVA